MLLTKTFKNINICYNFTCFLITDTSSVSNNEDNHTKPEEFLADQNSPPAAQKAKTDYSEQDKTKEESPVILHVHLGQETRAPLTQDLWNKVTKLLKSTLEIEDIVLELEIDFNLDWSDGKGVIRCIKENTVDIFIKLIQDFKVKGQKFRAYAKSHTIQGQGI